MAVIESTRRSPLRRAWPPWRAALYYAQRLVVQPAARRAVAAAIAATRGHRYKGRPPEVQPRGRGLEGEREDAADLAMSLQREGSAMLGTVLSQGQIAEIMAFLEQKVCFDLEDPGRRFRHDQPPAGTTMADYDVEDVIECPHIMELANDERILAAAGRYIGCTPTISNLVLRWSYPHDLEPRRFQRFHRDPDDWKFVKLFVYLTDVDERSGPHVHVPGSHRTKGSVRARTYSDEAISGPVSRMGLMEVQGPRGFGFLVDTYGLHKGKVPQSQNRLVLQVQYSILPNYANTYHPIVPKRGLAKGFNPYVNRLMIRPARSQGEGQAAPSTHDRGSMR